MQELYRITVPNGLVEIHVPHVRHDTFWSDPTHVRAFLPMTFEMMSKRRNRDWMARRVNSTMLAFVLDVDFEIEGMEQVYDPIWWAKVEAGQMTREVLRQKAAESWGVVQELQVRIRAVK
jgi:hypothetical protein